MALFKIHKGNSADLETNKPQRQEGFVYLTEDDMKFYIDTASGTHTTAATLTAAEKKMRRPLNASKADLLQAWETSPSDTAGRWTVTIPGITEDNLIDGLTIRIRINTSYNSSYNTLNVNNLGAKLVYYRYKSRLTSHVPQFAEMLLTYRTPHTANGVTYEGAHDTDQTYGNVNYGKSGWVLDSSYSDGNTYDRTLNSYERARAGEAIVSGQLCMFDKDWLLRPISQGTSATTKTANTAAFQLPRIVFVNESRTAGQITDASYIYENIPTNKGTTTFNSNVPTYSNIYLVGTLDNNGYFLLDTTNTTSYYIYVTAPSSGSLSTAIFTKGKYYLYVGSSYSSANYFQLAAYNQLYYCNDDNGLKLTPVAPLAAKVTSVDNVSYTAALTTGSESGTLTIDGTDYVIYHVKPNQFFWQTASNGSTLKLQLALSDNTTITSPALPTITPQWGGTGATSLDSGKVIIGNGTNAVTFKSIYSKTTAGSLNYTNATADYLVDKSALNFWDGRYDTSANNASNLAYSAQGKFGTIITANKSAWTKNRVLLASSTTNVASAPNLYTDGSTLGINKTSVTSGYSFDVEGAARINGKILTTNNINMLLGDNDRFVNWYYSTNETAGASWRIGVYGSGTSDTNYFVIESGTSATSATDWNRVLQIGQNTYNGVWAGNFDPVADDSKSLGNNNHRWKNIYGVNLYGDGANVTNINAYNIATGVLTIARGGTGASTAAGAVTNLMGSTAIGSGTQPVYYNGTKFTTCTAYSKLLTAASRSDNTLTITVGGTTKTTTLISDITHSWTHSTGGGPILNLTINDQDAAITLPTAGNNSGVVTADTQTIKGSKTFVDDTAIGRNIIRNSYSAGQGDLVLALGYKTGYPVYSDPTFLNSTNSISVYNNKSGSTVTHTRDTYTNFGIASPGTNSDYVIQIKNTGEAAPNLGGFYQTISSRANAEFVQIIRALIPAGYTLATAANPMGTGVSDQWLTSSAGTGKWEWYIRRVLCGQEGSFSTGGHISLVGPVGTTSNPVIWYLSYSNVYDVTRADYDGLRVRYADDLTGTLSVAHGGTGATSFTKNCVIMSGSSTTAALTTRAVVNNTSNTAIAASTSFPTMNTLYYGLTVINNASQTRASSIYAPTSAGTAGQILTAVGGTSAPTWANASSITVGAATQFASNATVTLTGDVTGVSAGSKKSWSIATTIGEGKVTNAMLAGSIANNKLVNSSITVGNTSISLGSAGKLKDIQASPQYNVGSTSNSTYILITFNKETSWMLSCTLHLYASYEATDIQISGYNYNTNHWSSPKAVILGSTKTSAIKVYFGYTGTYKLWAAVDAGNYGGASVTDLTNGYTQIDYENAITLTKVSALPDTLQTTVTAYRPWYRNETVTNATTAASAGQITTPGTTAQFWRGDNTWSNILKSTSNTTLGINSNLKIGTAIKDLHISIGSGSGTNIDSGNSGGVTFGTDSASYGGIYWQTSGSYGSRLHFATTSSFADGAYTRMLIDPAGNVGIGTLSPAYKLHVVGDMVLGNSGNKIIYYKGTKATKAMITFLDNTSDTNGNGIKIGGGGVVVVGAGESAGNLSPTVTSENLYLMADSTVYLYANADTIANRIGFATTTSGNIVPQKAEAANDNKQDLGASDNRWKTIYGTTYEGSVIKVHQGTAVDPSLTSNGRIEFDYSGGQPVVICYSANDSYRAPAGLKIMGGTSATPAWLEVEGSIYANSGYRVPHTGNTTGTLGNVTTPIYADGGQLKAGTALGASAYHPDSYFALASHGTHVTYGTSATAVATTSAAGTATTVSRSDHKHSISLATGDNNGQVKIAGTNVSVKGLGSNAYTSTAYLPLAGGTMTGAIVPNADNTISFGSSSAKWANIYATTVYGKINSTEILDSGDLTVNGVAYLNNETYAESLTANSLLVNGNSNFVQIPTAPTAADGTNDTQLATTAFVMNQLRYADAMVFKGVVNANGDLPATHDRGWTYKVGTAGTYAGIKCEVGDIIICMTDGTAANNAHWTVVQNNIDGAVTGPASATDNAIARFNGTTGKIIQNSGITISDDNCITIPHIAGKANSVQFTYSSTIDFFVGIGSGNVNHGIYDTKLGDWVLSAGSDNEWSLNGNAATATKLKTARNIWGQSFNGTADISGNFTMKNTSSRYHYFYVNQNNTNNTVAYMLYDSGNVTNVTDGRWYFAEYSPNTTADTTTTGFKESYRLPSVAVGLTENKNYNILTTKAVVTVAQGGTGQTSFAADSIIMSGDTTTAAFTTRGITNTTTAGALGGKTTWATDTTIPTINTLAYWDGRYQSTNNKSNLTYCVKGAFGDLAIINKPTSNTTTTFLRGDGTWQSVTWNNVSGKPNTFTPSSHTHGNLSNDGKITTAITVAANDYLIIGDNSSSGTIGKGPVFDGSTATKALTQKGTWETFNNYSHPTGDGNKHVPANGTSNGGKYLRASATAGTYAWEAAVSGVAWDSTNKKITYTTTSTTASTLLEFAATSPITTTGATNKITIAHANSGATAGSYGNSAAQTPAYGGTFNVPYITVNATGHITSISNQTVKIPASDNTDVSVSQSVTTTASWRKILLTHNNYTNWNDEVVADTGSVYEAVAVAVQPSTGTIRANALNAKTFYLYDTANTTSYGYFKINRVGKAPTLQDDGVTYNADGVTGQTYLVLGNNLVSSNSATGVNDNSAGYLYIYGTGTNYTCITHGNWNGSNLTLIGSTNSTAGSTGISYITLGNANKKSAANASSTGSLYLYSDENGYHSILTTSTTSNRNHYFPNATGWIATGGNGTSTGVGDSTHPIYLSTAGELKQCNATLDCNISGTAGSITWANVTGKPSSFTPSSHTHGNITNAGAIGTIANYSVYTTTGGVLTAGSLAVSDPTASGNAISFIDTISQSSIGKITVTKKTVRDANDSQSGIVSTSAQTFAGNKTFKGDIYPQTTNTYNLGKGGSSNQLRWKALFIGTNDTYGASDHPIYWNNGVPTTATVGDNFISYSIANQSGSFSILDSLYNYKLRGNRFAGFIPAGTTIQHSTDGGATWVEDTSISDTSKKALFTTSTSLYLTHTANTSAGETQTLTTADTKLRIIMDTGAGHVYTTLRKIMIYISTGGSQNCTVTIDAALQNNPTNYTHVICTDQPISGWSGWNVIQCNFTTYGNTGSSQYGRIRFTFSTTGNSSSYVDKRGLSILSIYGYGGVGWTTPSTLAITDHVYSFDQDFNVSFPKKVTAQSFSGILTPGADVTIANNDKLLIADNSDSNAIKKVSIAFDGSTATKALTQKGTWETFNNYSHPTGDGNKHIPANGTSNNGKYLRASATAGTYTWAQVDWSELTGKPDQATSWPNWGQILQNGANNIDEGSSDFTDNTELFSSYASNNGFADTNALGKVYRRDAIKLYNYIKGKLNSVYKTIQTAVTAPTAATNKWVSSIGQNTQGVISVSYSSLDTSGTWNGNAGSATKLKTAVNLWGNSFDGSSSLDGSLTFGNEKCLYFKINRKKDDGGGWAYSPLVIKDNAATAFVEMGVYGSGNTMNYLYIGAGTFNSTTHIRINASGEIMLPGIAAMPTIAVNDCLLMMDSSATNKIVKGPAFTTSTAKKFLKDIGTWTQVDWEDLTNKPSSYTPSSHVHGNITNAGELGTATRAVVTDANKKITVLDLTVSSATAETTTATTFVYSVTQNAQGKITVKTRPLPTYNNYSLPLAANGTRGGIQIGYSTSGKNYAVQLSNEKAYVNVPWTDQNVKQSASTTANWRKLLLHYKDDTTSTTAITESTNQIYAAVGISAQPSTGTLRASQYNVNDKVTLTWNDTTQSLDFIFN